MENIGLPSSLLSRFDLLFIVLDYHNELIDTHIADHVLRAHQWRGQVIENGNEVYLQRNALLHGTGNLHYLTIEFMKKYISYAKELKPQWPEKEEERDGVISLLSECWADLRAVDVKKSQPITPRAFETLIRLTVAHAKMRLSKVVQKVDARAAVDLLRAALFGGVETLEKRKKHKVVKLFDSDDEQQEEPEEEPRPVRKSARKKKEHAKEPEEQLEEEGMEVAEQLEKIKEVFGRLLREDINSITVKDFIKRVQEEKRFVPKDEVVWDFFQDLVKHDKVMIEGEGDETTIYAL
jgi:DNA replication licensing factor MCM3